jgi:hypothetical protein
MRSIAFLLMIFALPSLAAAQDNDDNFDPMTVDVVDAINCHIDARTYNGFAGTLDDSDQYWKKRGWKKLKSENAMMAEYRLPKPVEITTGYKTDHVAITSSGILAVLDLADPATIAGPEEIINEMDPDPMIEALVEAGAASRVQIEKEITFRKFLGERIIVDETEIEERFNMSFRTIIARSISNVSTHPGKTLYGCSYRIEMVDQDGTEITPPLAGPRADVADTRPLDIYTGMVSDNGGQVMLERCNVGNTLYVLRNADPAVDALAAVRGRSGEFFAEVIGRYRNEGDIHLLDVAALQNLQEGYDCRLRNLLPKIE